MSLSNAEIRKWSTLPKYGNGSKEIYNMSSDSWLNMPIIRLACERVGLEPYGVDNVSNEERQFWESQFMSEILEVEERLLDRVKEPNLQLRGDPKYRDIEPRMIKNILLNRNLWEGPQNLKKEFELLILGVDLKNRLKPKKIEILKEVGIMLTPNLTSEVSVEKKVSERSPVSKPGRSFRSKKSTPEISPNNNFRTRKLSNRHLSRQVQLV